MNSENTQIIVGIAISIIFLLGLAIGVQLYSVTSEPSSTPERSSAPQ